MATTATISPMAAAVEEIRLTDTLGVPLGPGLPGGFLHALGARTDLRDLAISGALLIDLYEVFTAPGVHYLSRLLRAGRAVPDRDSGADVQFVPADFRRFAPVLEARRAAGVATVAAPPDADGF